MNHDNLHRLVYYSRNRVAGSPDDLGAAVRIILDISRRNNAPLGITGALMFNAGCFAQVLEGDRTVLESTFERIQQDARHDDVSVLAFEPIDERTFGQWSMGFVGARPEHAAAFAGIAAESAFDPALARGDEVLTMLRTFALDDESAAA